MNAAFTRLERGCNDMNAASTSYDESAGRDTLPT
jgi:hypothetical protein